MPPSRSSQGFTLIELLVVVSIIAILAGMLIPAIGLIRTSAKLTQCAGQVRQFSLGILGFAADNEGKFPPPIAPCFGAVWGLDTWDVTVARQLEIEGGGYRIFRCPFDKEPDWAWWPGGPTQPRRSYSYVCPLVNRGGWVCAYTDPAINVPFNPDRIRNPLAPDTNMKRSSIVMLGDWVHRGRLVGPDVNASIGFGGGSLVQGGDFWQSIKHPVQRGLRWGNVACFDGHVERIEYDTGFNNARFRYTFE